jgi:hypothetical protein
MALIAAILTLLGVITGVYGTYLMTAAYHPFDSEGWGVTKNFFRVMVHFATFRWKSAKLLIRKAAFYGEMNKEDRALSLAGIYVLSFSFLLQTVGAAFAIADVLFHHG